MGKRWFQVVGRWVWALAPAPGSNSPVFIEKTESFLDVALAWGEWENYWSLGYPYFRQPPYRGFHGHGGTPIAGWFIVETIFSATSRWSTDSPKMLHVQLDALHQDVVSPRPALTGHIAWNHSYWRPCPPTPTQPDLIRWTLGTRNLSQLSCCWCQCCCCSSSTSTCYLLLVTSTSASSSSTTTSPSSPPFSRCLDEHLGLGQVGHM